MNNLKEKLEFILNKADKQSWQTFKFGDLAWNISERVEPQTTDAEIYVGLEHLDSDSIHIRRFGKPSDVKGTKLRVYKGDVIFGKRRVYQRKAGVADFDGICSAHAMVLRANPENIEVNFFPFFLHSSTFMSRALQVSEGSLSPTIKWKILEQQEFKIPPKEAQRQIVNLLLAFDKLHEKSRKSLSEFEIYRTAYLEENVLDKKGIKLTLKKLGDVIRGVGYKPTDVGTEYSESYYPILRSNNIQDGALEFDDLNFINKARINNTQLLQTGDTVICMSNGSKELVGKAAPFTGYKTPISFGSFCAAYRPKKIEDVWLVRSLFQTNSYRHQIRLLLTGSNINNLKPSDIESISFHVSEKIKDSSIRQTLENLDKMEESLVSYCHSTNLVMKDIMNRL